MEIKIEYPPNYEDIKKRFDLSESKPVFTYGNIVYNPHDSALRPDQLVHEEIHCKQQANCPDLWWNKYLTDNEFLINQEVDAYAVQYDYVKKLKGVTSKKALWFLDRLAEILSSKMYGSLMTFSEAKTKIRKKQKEICTK